MSNNNKIALNARPRKSSHFIHELNYINGNSAVSSFEFSTGTQSKTCQLQTCNNSRIRSTLFFSTSLYIYILFYMEMCSEFGKTCEFRTTFDTNKCSWRMQGIQCFIEGAQIHRFCDLTEIY